MRHVAVGLGALFLAATPWIVVSCAGEKEDVPTRDAGADGMLLNEAQPEAGADVDPGPQSPCGDRSVFSGSSPWPVLGGCPKRANISDGLGPRDAKLAWSVPIAAGSSPVIGGDRLVWVGTNEGDVVAIGRDGLPAFSSRLSGPIRASGAVFANGTVVLGTVDGTLYGIARGTSPSDGGTDADVGDADVPDGATPPARVVFSRKLGPISGSANALGDGTLLVPTNDGKLHALSSDGATTKWSATTNDTAGSSPAVSSDGTLYVASSDKKLYALGRDGSTKWTYDVGAPPVFSPVVGGDETIYVGASDGKLHAVSPEGKVRWTYAAGGPITGGPAVDPYTVYVGSEDKKLHAVAVATGTARWQYATLGAVATPVVDFAGTVYVGSADARLYVLSKSGSLLFAVNARGPIKSAPALSDDGMMFVTTTTSVVAIGP